MNPDRPLQCLIIDDEPLAQERLQLFIAKIPEKATLVAACSSLREAWKVLQTEEIDLLLMDICFSLLDDENREGLDFVMFTQKDPRVPRVIFITGHPEHAAEVWDLEVCDFIIKPASFDRFERAIDKAIRDKPAPKKNEQAGIIIDYFDPKEGHRSQFILFKDIIYIKANDGFIEIYTLISPKKPICPYWKFTDTIATLPQYLIKQSHRSYACNRNFVQSWSNTSLKLLDGTELPISEKYRSEFLNWITYSR
jgi:two-component system LytT family response regulator